MSGGSVDSDSGSDSGESDSGSDSGDFDAALALCQNRCCRIVLGTLAAERRPLTLDDLTKIVYEYTRQTPITEAPENALTEIRVSLYHAHLPKLASAGFIRYDSERYLVEPTGQIEQVDRTLTTLLDADPALEEPMEL